MNEKELIKAVQLHENPFSPTHTSTMSTLEILFIIHHLYDEVLFDPSSKVEDLILFTIEEVHHNPRLDILSSKINKGDTNNSPKASFFNVKACRY